MLLQEIKEQVINQYRTSKGSITTAMHGAAKTAIERELSNVPLEELPAEELYEIGAAIRDRVYEPVFEKQAEEAERRQAESQARSENNARSWAHGVAPIARRKFLSIKHGTRRTPHVRPRRLSAGIDSACSATSIRDWMSF